jgi:hypothetical protein
MKNQKDIAKEIRRKAIKKNGNYFRRSKLGMIVLYIVLIFPLFNNFTTHIVHYWSLEQGSL